MPESIDERLLNKIGSIERAIFSLGHVIERLYQDWKFPVSTLSEQMQPEWDRQESKNNFQQQLDLLKKQNKILIITVVVGVFTAFCSLVLGLVEIWLKLKAY
jgi:hypothetical protein